MIKLLVFGSSMAKYLSFHDKGNKIHNIAGREVQFIYKHFSGKSFEYFLDKDNHPIIDKVLRCKPDIICVISGGNSIKLGVEWNKVLEDCRDFYSLLYDKYVAMNPRGIIIASQVALRFNRNPFNIHRCPDPDTFRSFRNKVNRKINSLRSKQYVLLIRGLAI